MITTIGHFGKRENDGDTKNISAHQGSGERGMNRYTTEDF